MPLELVRQLKMSLKFIYSLLYFKIFVKKYMFEIILAGKTIWVFIITYLPVIY